MKKPVFLCSQIDFRNSNILFYSKWSLYAKYFCFSMFSGVGAKAVCIVPALEMCGWVGAVHRKGEQAQSRR